jgi:hypothetical protein
MRNMLCGVYQQVLMTHCWPKHCIALAIPQ